MSWVARPELTVCEPFVIETLERPAVEAVFGADAVAAWDSSGRSLGWGIGIDDAGAWRFIVAED